MDEIIPETASGRAKLLLARPLIVGASISADYGTKSPGRRLALRYTTPANIRIVARNGQPGSSTVAMLNGRDVEDRSCILAIDTFFWDSTKQNLEASLTALKQLVDWSCQFRIPLVLGFIPELLPGFQSNAQVINREIALRKAQSDLITVMPFNKMYEDLLLRGFVETRGKKLSLVEIIPDGIHLSDRASDFLADVMLSLILGEAIG